VRLAAIGLICFIKPSEARFSLHDFVAPSAVTPLHFLVPRLWLVGVSAEWRELREAHDAGATLPSSATLYPPSPGDTMLCSAIYRINASSYAEYYPVADMESYASLWASFQAEIRPPIDFILIISF